MMLQMASILAEFQTRAFICCAACGQEHESSSFANWRALLGSLCSGPFV